MLRGMGGRSTWGMSFSVGVFFLCCFPESLACLLLWLLFFFFDIPPPDCFAGSSSRDAVGI